MNLGLKYKNNEQILKEYQKKQKRNQKNIY